VQDSLEASRWKRFSDRFAGTTFALPALAPLSVFLAAQSVAAK
jgi:hypothetical protein